MKHCQLVTYYKGKLSRVRRQGDEGGEFQEVALWVVASAPRASEAVLEANSVTPRTPYMMALSIQTPPLGLRCLISKLG